MMRGIKMISSIKRFQLHSMRARRFEYFSFESFLADCLNSSQISALRTIVFCYLETKNRDKNRNNQL